MLLLTALKAGRFTSVGAELRERLPLAAGKCADVAAQGQDPAGLSHGRYSRHGDHLIALNLHLAADFADRALGKKIQRPTWGLVSQSEAQIETVELVFGDEVVGRDHLCPGRE